MYVLEPIRISICYLSNNLQWRRNHKDKYRFTFHKNNYLEMNAVIIHEFYKTYNIIDC